MFCPQCSQAQVNTELKFCSRCGFPLLGVKDLVANGGKPLAKQSPANQRAMASRRIVQGIMLMMSAMIGGGILTAVGREYGFSRLPGTLVILIGFFIGAMRMLTAMTHASTADPKSTQEKTTGPIVADQARQPAELSEARTRPIDQEFVRPRDSRVPVPIASVTEHTTELLDQS